MIKFVDYGVNYSSIFSDVSFKELELLHIDCEEKKIPFNPVVTAKTRRIAFVGLNAYFGADYLEAFHESNFTVWCQKRYNQKIFNVMDMYSMGASPSYMNNGGLYFTDFVKIVLPESHFTQEGAVKRLIASSPKLKTLFQSLLKKEIESLLSEQCRVFVCFGNAATTYFCDTLHQSLNINCETVGNRIKKSGYPESSSDKNSEIGSRSNLI